MKVSAVTISYNYYKKPCFHNSKTPNTPHIDNPSFKYRSILKTEWLKGNLPSVKKGIYGGKLTKKNITLEHIVPHSKGGKTELYNLALAVNVNNWNRADKSFKNYFNLVTFEEYVSQFEKVSLPNFNGRIYSRDLINQVRGVLKEERSPLLEAYNALFPLTL